MIYREATGSEPWTDDATALAADMAEGHQFPLSVVKVDPATIDTLADALSGDFSYRREVGWKSPERFESDKAEFEAAFVAIGRDVPEWWEDEWAITDTVSVGTPAMCAAGVDGTTRGVVMSDLATTIERAIIQHDLDDGDMGPMALALAIAEAVERSIDYGAAYIATPAFFEMMQRDDVRRIVNAGVGIGGDETFSEEATRRTDTASDRRGRGG